MQYCINIFRKIKSDFLCIYIENIHVLYIICVTVNVTSNLKTKFMPNCQISLRVEKKVPSTANMAHSFQISVLGKKYSVTFSDRRDHAIKAFIVPDDHDIAVYQEMPKKDQKKVQHEARIEIQRFLCSQ